MHVYMVFIIHSYCMYMLINLRFVCSSAGRVPLRELLPCRGEEAQCLDEWATKSTRPVSGFHYSPFPLSKRAACLPWAATCVGG